MIKGYTRPQLLVRQILDVVPDPEEKSLNAFVLGPQYDLFRYTNADERAAMKGTAFVENTVDTKPDTFTDPDQYQKVPYEGLKPHHIVDQGYARLYGENLEGQLWTANSAINSDDTDPYEFKLVSLLHPNKIHVHRRGAFITATHTPYGGGGYISAVSVTYSGSGYVPDSHFDQVVPNGNGDAVIRLFTDGNGLVYTESDSDSSKHPQIIQPGTGYIANVTFEATAGTNGANVGYKDSTLIPELMGRPIKPGDILYATLNNTKVRRSVRGVEREKVAAHYGTDLNDDGTLAATNQMLDKSVLNPILTANATFGNVSSPANWQIALATGSNPSDWNGMVQGSNYGTNTTNALRNVQYDNQYGERYTLTVTRANITDHAIAGWATSGRFRIRSSSGAFSSNNAVATQSGADFTIDDVALGGLKIKITAPDSDTPLRLGDTFTFVVIGAYKPLDLTDDLTLIAGCTYRGPVDTRYQIKVTVGGVLPGTASLTPCQLQVMDTAGIDKIQNYTILNQGAEYDLGTYGLRFKLPSGNSIGTQATAGAITRVGDAITAIAVSAGGTNYTSPPEVTITAASGHGTGAAAHAVVVNGVVTAIVIDEGGTGYDVDPTVTLSEPARFLRTGDVYYVDAVSEKAVGPYSIIVLNGQASDITGWTDVDLDLNKFNIDVRALYSGIVEPRRDTAPVKAWEASPASITIGSTTTTGGILVKDTLKLFIADRDEDEQWVTVRDSAYAKLFAHWRGLVPATSGDKIKLYTNEDAITAAFGIEDYDNPVCQGALIAFRGAQEKPIFVAKTATDDLAGYTALIRQAENIEGIYSIAPTGYSIAVGHALKAHVDKMSQEDWKLWRRVYLGYQNPGSYVVMDDKDDGSPYIATVTSNASGNVRVICTDGDFISRGIRPGDLFRTSFYEDEWGDPAYAEYVVYTVLEEDELILESGPVSPISPAISFQIWRPNNGLSQCEWAGERGESYSDRRVCIVWVDTPQQTDENAEVQHPPVYYVACEVAGLRSAVLPQQGLTYTELNYSLDACPLMFTKYTQEELNIAAAKGVYIVTQDHEDGPVYIRHQLTTDTNHGILYYEDSVGTNLDNISYTVKAVLTPYPGKRNANPEVLEELETKMRNVLNEFMKNPGGFTSIGPALIRWQNLKIGIDKVFKDRINIEVDLELPLPINTLLVKLRGRTIQDDLIISTEILVANPNVTTAAAA